MTDYSTGSIDLKDMQGLAPTLYTEPVDPARTALIIVDMQTMFCRGNPERSKIVLKALGLEQPVPQPEWMQKTIANCQRLLSAFRQHRLRIVHVVLGCWTEDAAEMAPHYKRSDVWRRTLGLEPQRRIDLPGMEIVPELTPQRGEIVLQKVTPSAFGSTGLDCILRNMGIQYLVMCGTITYACLGSTALEASFHYGYSVTMVEDASIAAGAVASHKVWLRMFDQQFGRVRTTEGVLNEIATTGGHHDS